MRKSTSSSSSVRASAFFLKEMVEVLRQPRLILSLILGPFLILLLFGLGFKNEARPVSTLFVINAQSPLAQQVEELATTAGPQLVFAGVTDNEQEARARLARNEVGLVVVSPADPEKTFQNDEQSEFIFYHNEIDPAQIGYIDSIGQGLVDELNRRVLASIAESGQQQSTDVHTEVKAARENAASMRQALESGDVARARQLQSALRGNVNDLALVVGTTAGVLSSIEQTVGGSPNPGQSQEIVALLSSLQAESSQGDVQDGQVSYSSEIQSLSKTETDLEKLDTLLAEFRSISPKVLVQPFKATVQGVSGQSFAPADFFTPGVIVLLLQHIAVTIASLSIVRERRSGTIELFRVSPISSSETLAGKYISYLIFGGVIAAILTLLLYYGLGSPMFGNWWNYALVVFLVLFAALGVGFLISLLAETESQAVQLAMIVLLLSVFFGGFFLDLRYLWGPVRVVSWLLPATYGTLLMQNIMLRGGGLILLYIAGLLGIAIVLLFGAWMLLRRRMAHE